jgi:hypothetical protein
MPLHGRGQPVSAPLWVAALALLLLLTSLAQARQRWAWERVCRMTCGPYLPADLPAAWIASWHRALDSYTPLAVAGAAALVLLALWIGLHHGCATAHDQMRDR